MSLGALLLLGACSADVATPEPVTVEAPSPRPVRVAAKAVRPKRAEPVCTTANDLSAKRKEELFRRFAAIQDGGADQMLVQAQVQAPAAPCRTAGR